MKKIVLIVLATLIGVPSLMAQDKTGITAAAFLSIPSYARGTAMGSAFVAIADDETAMFWNPGGLAQVTKNSASFSNASWFVGSGYQDVSAAFYTGNSGTFGLRVMVLNYGEMEVNTIQNPEGTGELINPMDLQLNLTYSRYLTTSFSFGASVKYVSQRIWKSEASGIGVDLGILYKSDFKNLRIGMAITNYGTDMQMSGDNLKVAHDIDPDNNGNNDRLPAFMETNAWAMPLNFRVGLAMDAFANSLNRLTLAIDAKHPSDNSEALDVGFEYGFKETVFLRGGYRNLFTAIPSDGGFTAGFGLNYNITPTNAVRIGYSFQHHEYLDSPQIWSLGVTF